METNATDLENLTLLGGNTKPSKTLEAFPNRSPGRYYLVTLDTDELTCVCDSTTHSDFATIKVAYVPDEEIDESKPVNLY